MPLLDTLKSTLNESLKKGDSTRVETIRYLIAAVRNVAIDKYGAAGESAVKDEDVLDVVKKQIKTHKESVEAFTKANRMDLVEKEQAQLTILESYAPKELSDDELRVLLAPVIQSGETNFGKLMGAAMGVTKGKASGSRVSAILKELQTK